MRHARFLALSARFMANTTRHAAGPHARRRRGPMNRWVSHTGSWPSRCA